MTGFKLWTSISEDTALPTEPQPSAKSCHIWSHSTCRKSSMRRLLDFWVNVVLRPYACLNLKVVIP